MSEVFDTSSTKICGSHVKNAHGTYWPVLTRPSDFSLLLCRRDHVIAIHCLLVDDRYGHS